jgi:hypothetical protein
MEVVADAEVNLRVTALGYALDPSDPRGRTSGVPASTVRFHVEETIKGAYAQKEIVLPGYLSDRDDWNDRPVPYDFIRPEGRHDGYSGQEDGFKGDEIHWSNDVSDIGLIDECDHDGATAVHRRIHSPVPAAAAVQDETATGTRQAGGTRYRRYT